jgi:hypothetical protein
VITTSSTATNTACRTRAPRKEAAGSGVPLVRLRTPSCRWKLMLIAMLLKHAVMAAKHAIDAT